MRDLVLKFPPALVSGTLLGHDGSLVDEEVTHLESLGYEVKHYQALTGPRLVEAYIEGCIKGLIAFDAVRFKAAEAARKMFSKKTKQQAEAELEKRNNEVDAVAILTEGLDSKPAEEQKRRRGKPPGG